MQMRQQGFEGWINGSQASVVMQKKQTCQQQRETCGNHWHVPEGTIGINWKMERWRLEDVELSLVK